MLRKKSEDFFILCVIGIALLGLLPFHYLFQNAPATGGDTASHFFPIVQILKTHSWRPWNPGNLAGEPQLVHYFPLPFILIAAAGLLVPVAIAFNWLIVLPTLLLPFAIYRGLRDARLPGRTPLWAAALSCVFILNRSYSAWGGNLLSTLAGQFAHAYALLFFFLFIGSLQKDFELRRWPLRSALWAAAIVLSHAYIALALPIVILAFFLIADRADRLARAGQALGVGLFSLLLTLWWIVPSLQNAPWTTPYASRWLDNLAPAAYLPKLFLVYALLAIICLIGLLSRRSGREKLILDYARPLLFWTLLSIFYFHLIWAFPHLGLVDIRAIPQIHLFLFVILALLFSAVTETMPPRWQKSFTIFACLIFIGHVFLTESSTPRHWLQWNWSSWKSKKLAGDFSAINEFLRGDFSQGRVVYEHANIQNQTGTLRAFEMLPYFSGRATLESVYMQATPLAPATYYLQSLVGRNHSCPFGGDAPCGSLNLKRAADFMPMLGVQQIILSSPPALAQARSNGAFYNFQKTFGPWSVFRYKEEVSLAEAFRQKAHLENSIPASAWKRNSMKSLLTYKKGDPWIVEKAFLDPADQKKLADWSPDASAPPCPVKLRVETQQMTLETPCPGVPHVIKMSYHPSFRTNSGDRLFLVYPGYLGLIPSQNTVVLKFGESATWKFFDIVSGISGLGALLFLARDFLAKRAKKLSKRKK